MQGKRKLEFTVREWEDVALEIDIDRIGNNPDWSMLAKGAKKLGIAPYIFRKYLLLWVTLGKKTADMPIIRSRYDEQRDSGENKGVRTLPTLKRRR